MNYFIIKIHAGTKGVWDHIKDKDMYVRKATGDEVYYDTGWSYDTDLLNAHKFKSEDEAKNAIMDITIKNPKCYGKHEWERNSGSYIVFGSNLETPGVFEIQEVEINTRCIYSINEKDIPGSSYNTAIKNNELRISYEEFRHLK